MSDLEFCKSATQDPLIILRFSQEKDIFLVFCADRDKQTGQLSGITLWGLRKSRGPKPFALQENLVPTIFKPKLHRKSNHEYTLDIQPLKEKLTIVQKKDHGHFTCIYPFREEKKAGQITEVVVDYQTMPMKMWFTIHGTHKASKDAPSLLLQQKIETNQTFTDDLYDFFMNNES